MLDLARKRVSRRRHGERLSGILLAGWGSKDNNGDRFVTDEEMTSLLTEADHDFRSHMLWNLEMWSKNPQTPWKDNVLEFLQSVWPKHTRVRTPKISARLCDLALAQTDNFPAVARVVSELVTKVDDEHIFLPELRNAEETISNRYPKEMLDLLYAVLGENPVRWSYGVAGVIRNIEKAAPALLTDPKLVELKSRTGDI